MTGRFARVGWFALLALPCVELGAHALSQAHVPAQAEWRDAAAFVRGEFHPGDLATVAPTWADPWLRHALGDRVDLAMAGRSDTAAYARLWALTIRDAGVAGAPARAPELTVRFGRVTVKRWTLARPTVAYDFVERVRDAHVDWLRHDGARPCPWRQFPWPERGGLGFGVLDPVERFACDGGRGALWVAPVVMEDLDLAPRRCVRQHPSGGDEPIRVRYPDVPLGDRIVFYGGLYYEDERMRQGGPVHARIVLGDQALGAMTHIDGDGWKKLVVSTPGRRGTRGEVAIEVSAPDPVRRGFCWAASVRMDGGA